MSLSIDYFCLPLRTNTLPPATHTTCYLVGRGQLLVVDPGSPYPAEQRRLQRRLARRLDRGARVQAVLLTHHHRDHTAGAMDLARDLGTPLAAHPWTLRRVLQQDGPAPAGVLELTGGEQLVTDPGLTLEVLHTPGHAPGHLCLWDADRRTLLGGDMVAARGTVVINPPEGDMTQYLDSLERLARLDPAPILAAHGGPILHGRRCIAKLLAHRAWRERRVLQALDATPRELLVITRQAYRDLRSGPLLDLLASRSALAHLLKLEAAGQARRAGQRWAVGDRGSVGDR